MKPEVKRRGNMQDVFDCLFLRTVPAYDVSLKLKVQKPRQGSNAAS